MSIINNVQLRKIIFATLDADFELNKDAVYDLMAAANALIDHAEIHDEQTNQATEEILTLALAFGQTAVGGSRVDYAARDIIKAVSRRLKITKIDHDYLRSLTSAIRQSADDPDRELATIDHLIQTVPQL